jgi:hypothetical protein
MSRPKKQMSRSKKRVSRRAKTGKRKTSGRTRRRTTRRRASFASVWKKLGDAVLRGAVVDSCWDRKTLAAKLAGDGEIQRLVVERTVGLLRVVAATAPELRALAPVVLAEEPPASREDELADEYALGLRAADCSAESTSDEMAAAEAKANWRIF